MKVKESARIIDQPHYAYGEAGIPDVGVPPNAELVYEIRLNNFEKVRRRYDSFANLRHSYGIDVSSPCTCMRLCVRKEGTMACV